MNFKLFTLIILLNSCFGSLSKQSNPSTNHSQVAMWVGIASIATGIGSVFYKKVTRNLKSRNYRPYTSGEAKNIFYSIYNRALFPCMPYDCKKKALIHAINAPQGVPQVNQENRSKWQIVNSRNFEMISNTFKQLIDHHQNRFMKDVNSPALLRLLLESETFKQLDYFNKFMKDVIKINSPELLCLLLESETFKQLNYSNRIQLMEDVIKINSPALNHVFFESGGTYEQLNRTYKGRFMDLLAESDNHVLFRILLERGHLFLERAQCERLHDFFKNRFVEIVKKNKNLEMLKVFLITLSDTNAKKILLPWMIPIITSYRLNDDNPTKFAEHFITLQTEPIQDSNKPFVEVLLSMVQPKQYLWKTKQPKIWNQTTTKEIPKELISIINEFAGVEIPKNDTD